MVPPCVPLTEEGSPTASIDRSSISDTTDAAAAAAADVDDNDDNAPTEADDFPEDTQEPTPNASEGGEADAGADADADDGFGDFDEFEEGGEGDDDFGDFDDGFHQGEEQAETTFDSPQNQTPVHAPPQAPPGPVSATHLAQANPCFLLKHASVMSELTCNNTACPRLCRTHIPGSHH